MTEKDVQDALKDALRSGDKTAASALRMLISAIKYKKIEDLEKGEFSDEKLVSLVQKMIKRYKESIEQFENGGRQDLVEKEREEMEVILKFLPVQLGEDDVKTIVDEAIKSTGASGVKDMGKAIKYVMERVKGRAEGGLVSKLVKEKLQ
ncbi:MAG: GatB/YqeY domain-containing protein [Candidatus Omnitrophica bacterium]|nr:GatB/YqeY domain-containing protein [Candidatus Omnitrophota bacterium]MDD4012707.1 GatB/YqeY domain-containing protein [Candidatus Omnitrophota bacterium]